MKRLATLLLAFSLTGCAWKLPPVIVVERPSRPEATKTGTVSEAPTIPCLFFPEPVPVACSANGKLIIEGATRGICQLHDPDRLILYHPDGKTVVTLVGATCFTAINGAY